MCRLVRNERRVGGVGGNGSGVEIVIGASLGISLCVFSFQDLVTQLAGLNVGGGSKVQDGKNEAACYR